MTEASSALEIPLLEPHEPRSATLFEPIQSRRKGLSHLRRLWSEARRNLWDDLRGLSWRDGLTWLPLYPVLLAVCVGLIMLPLDQEAKRGNLGGNARIPNCRPDGSFGYGYNPWAISGFFQITLRYGSLTFTEAKIIDIAWDITIGRVGQSMMAYYSWKAFSSYVRVSMELGPVTFDTFFASHLESTASLVSTATIARDFYTRKGLRSRTAMVFLISTMIFILAWPTLAGAMTGYTAAESAYLLDHSGNLMSTSGLRPLAYVIHDGWRVGLDGEYLIAYDGSGYRARDFYNEFSDSCIKAYNNGPCGDYLAFNVSDYFDMIMNGTDKANLTWNGEILQPPLNISAFYIPELSNLARDKLLSPSHIAFTIVDSNMTYREDYVLKNGSCQAREDFKFQWGFSFLQLFTDLILFFIWMVGAWALWLKAHKELQRRDGVEVSGKYQAVLDLAAALTQDLDQPTLTSSQLTKHVKTKLRGGAMTAEGPALYKLTPYSFRANILPWIQRHDSDIFIYAVSVPFATFAIAMRGNILVGMALIIAGFSALIVATSIGNSSLSRGLLLLGSTVIIAIVAIVSAFL